MTKQKTDDLLGVGLYTAPEAARYARVKYGKLSRWLYGKTAVLEPQLGEIEGQRVVTFLDFAQALSINEIRLTKIPLSRIREAYRRAQEDYGVEYPFAMKHGVFVFGDLSYPKKCKLGIFIPGKDSDDQRGFVKKLAYQLTGKNRKNQLLWSIVQPFSEHLEFNDAGFASEYTAHKAHGHTIVMNPEVRFGKPFLVDVGFEAETLANAVAVERSVKRVSRLYHVDESAVRAALDYHKLLNTPIKPPPPKPLAA